MSPTWFTTCDGLLTGTPAKERWQGSLQEQYIPAAEARLKADPAYQESLKVKERVEKFLAGMILVWPSASAVPDLQSQIGLTRTCGSDGRGCCSNRLVRRPSPLVM